MLAVHRCEYSDDDDAAKAFRTSFVSEAKDRRSLFPRPKDSWYLTGKRLLVIDCFFLRSWQSRPKANNCESVT